MNPKPKKIISRAAAMLLTVIMAFAGAQTARAQKPCYVEFDISGKGTVVFGGKTVTNDQPIEFILPYLPYPNALTITPETGYVVSSVTYDAPDWLSIDLKQKDDFQWILNILQYVGSETPTITVHIVFNKPLAGGADEALAVALTADDDLSLTGGWYKVESDLTLGYTVNLLGDTHIIIASGKTLTVNTSDEYGIYGSPLTDENGISGYALTVSGEGTLSVSANLSAISVDNYTQTGCAVTLSGDIDGLIAKNNVSISGGSLTTRAYYGIDTNIGSITISGGTVSSSGDRAGLYACDAVSITGGTVSASGDDYGIRGYSVSITGGQVNASSGGIYSNYGDITLGWTSATDYITASGFTMEEGYHVKIADGQTLYGGGFPSASLIGTIGDPSALNGLMLRPTAAVTKSGTNEYTIWNAAGWDAFCDRLAADDGKAFFSGKTVKLGADITVSRMAGADYHDFCGTFDGQEHTLTVDYTATENYAAPFRNAENGCVVENLHVAGTIATSAQYAAGIIGNQFGTVTIRNCRVSVTIQSTTSGDGTHGGLVAVKGNSNSAHLTIEGCVFDGKIVSTGTGDDATTNCGGFVGWRKDNGSLTITNCLYAPTADYNTVTVGATFARNGGSITNCYYTRTLGDAQGKALHSVTADDGVTVAHAGVATHYATSGITAYKASDASGDDDPFIAGILYNNVLYAGSGDEVSLTLANSSGEAPLGYYYLYSVSAGTLSGSTLTMPDEDVTVSFTPGALRSTGEAVAVSYIDEDGQPASHNAIALDETMKTLGQYGEETWYFVGADNSRRSQIYKGDVHIILCDGKTMTVNGDYAGDYAGIWGYSGSLTIYGQTLGTGTLNATGKNDGIYQEGNVVIHGGAVNATGTNSDGIYASSSVTITGGRVTATRYNGINAGNYVMITGGRVTATANSIGILSDKGDITITGGQVTATGNEDGICSNNGNITLGWTSASDYITASSYNLGCLSGFTVNIANGQTLYDEDDNEYTYGEYGVYFKNMIDKTLRPLPNVLALDDAADNSAAITANDRETRNVILYGRTLYKDGDWNTLCLPFDISTASGTLSGDNVQAMTLNTTTSNFAGSTLTLNFDAATGQTIPAGTPFIIKWDNTGVNIENPVFTDVYIPIEYTTADAITEALDDASSKTSYVDFIGTYSPIVWESENNSVLFLGGNNTLYFPQPSGSEKPHVNAFRGYFQLKGLTASEVSLARMNFDEQGTQNGIGHTEITEITEKADAAWYSLDGVKLDSKPSSKGIYIHGNKKVVVE